MENKRPLIVTGLVLLIILAIIAGVVYYLINFIRNRQSPTTQQLFPRASVSATPRPSGSVSPTPLGTNPSTSTKQYRGVSYQLQYPTNWGLLTCNNSQNFELDPTTSADRLNVACDRAIKPVTVLVDQFNCVGGNVITLGGLSVRKVVSQIKTTSGGSGTEYHWCVNSTPNLDITHRVGTGAAFSASDYSAQVEQAISTIRTGGGS